MGELAVAIGAFEAIDELKGRLVRSIHKADRNASPLDVRVPAEIERVLLSHPLIREAGVVGIPDPNWGEAVVAAVVLRDGATLMADDVIAHVRAHLAGFKKPKHVCFLATMPRTAASQQIHKPLLREMVLEQLAGLNARVGPPEVREASTFTTDLTLKNGS
jgi:hypothetical protein